MHLAACPTLLHGAAPLLIRHAHSATPLLVRHAHRPTMNMVEAFASGTGAIFTGVLTGAAVGPAVSAAAATQKGLRLGAERSLLGIPLAFLALFSALTLGLAAVTLQLGSKAVLLASDNLMVRLPILLFMLVAVAALVPTIAILSGTFFSPAVPFRDVHDASEYVDMQDSYRSDAWQPPKLWPGRDSRND